MKAELVDVNETRKNLTIEIPRDVVDAQIERVARDYSRKARIPGFRPGKAPARVIKQRFRDQILHDVAHELVPTRDRRGDARARPGTGRYAGRARRQRRGRQPADLHGLVRYGAGVRAGRSLGDLAAPSARRDRRAGGRRCPDAAARARGALRAGRRPRRRRRRYRHRRSGSQGSGRQDRESQGRRHHARRQGESAGLRRAAARARGRRGQVVHHPVPGRLRDRRAAEHERGLHGHRQGHQAPRRPRARRRVREGSRGSSRTLDGAARAGCGRIWSTKRGMPPSARCGPT